MNTQHSESLNEQLLNRSEEEPPEAPPSFSRRFKEYFLKEVQVCKRRIWLAGRV